MNLIPLLFLKSIFSKNTNQDSYFFIHFPKDEGKNYIAPKTKLVKEQTFERYTKVKEEIAERNLTSVVSFSWVGDEEQEFFTLLNYIMDIKIYANPTMYQDTEYFNFIKNIFNIECKDYFKKEDCEAIKYEKLSKIISRIEVYITMYLEDKTGLLSLYYSEFKRMEKILSEKQGEIKEIFDVNHKDSTLFYTLLEKLKLKSIPSREFYSKNYNFIEELIDFIKYQLETQSTGNIFIFINFENSVIERIGGVKTNIEKPLVYDIDIHLDGIRCYRQIIEKELNNSEGIRKLRKIINENPRLQVLDCCSYMPTNFKNVLHSLLKIAKCEEYQNLQIQNNLQRLQDPITELGKTMIKYVNQILFDTNEAYNSSIVA